MDRQPANSTTFDATKPIARSILKGRTALITGAGSGIGLAIATALAESDVTVILADINETGGSQAAESLQQRGHQAHFIKTDVTSWDDQIAAFAFAAKLSPDNTVDIVVPAAGIRTQLADLPHPSQQDGPTKPPTAALDINLTGQYFSMYIALWYFSHSPPHPAKQILFVSSMAGYSSSAGALLTSDYAGSKFGVRGMWQTLRKQGQRYGGARFNLVAPTFVDTPMFRADEVEEFRAKGLKIAAVADVVDGAMRCLSDSAISGRAVIVCSGEANGGAPGSANFDVCDDMAGLLGGRALLENGGKLAGPPASSA